MKKKFLTLLFILIFVSTALISCYESIENLNSTSKSVESQGVEVFQSDSISWVRYSDENFSGLGYSPKAIGDIKSSQTFNLVPFGFEQDVKGLTFTLKENQASFWKQMQTSEAALIHANKKVVFKGFCGRGDNPGLVFQAVYFEMEGVKQAYAVIFSNKEDSVNKKHVICSIDHLEKTLNTKVFPKENLSSENGVVYIDLKLQMDSLTNKLSNAFKSLDKGVSKTINGFEQANSELYQVIDKRTERVGGSSAGVYETATCRRPALLGVGRGGDQPASASGAGRRTARVRRAALARMLHVDDARNRASLGEASEVVVEDDDVDPCSARRFFPRGTSLAPMFPPRMRLTSKLLAWLQSPEAPQADARLFFCIEDWLRTHARVEHTVRGALGAHGASSVASAAAAPVAYSEFQPYAARDDVAESLASLPAAVALMASPLASTDGDAASSVAGSSVVTCSSLRDVVGGVLVLPRERNAAAASWTTGPALPPLHFAPASLQQLVEVGAVIDLLSEHEGTGEVLAAYDVEGTKRHGGGLANLYMLEAAPGVWEGSAGTSTAAITQHSRLGSTSGSRVSTSVLRPLTESEIRELTVVYLLRDGAIAEDAGAVWPASDRTGGGDRDGEEKADETGGVGREELGRERRQQHVE